jgi:hypothetical protein
MRTVRAGQQADGDFLLDQRCQRVHENRLAQQLEQPQQRIDQGGVRCFDRDGPIGSFESVRG